MSRQTFEFLELEEVDFSQKPPEPGLYESCKFTQCHAGSAGFRGLVLADCQWEGGSWVSVPIGDSLALRGVIFRNTEIRQCDFSRLNTLGLSLSFESCKLEHVLFNELNLSKTKFLDCIFRSCDFTGTNLKGADFSNSSLDQVVFSRSNLEKADFRTARDFVINPADNQMKGARFSALNLAGLLQHWGLSLS